MQKLLLFLAFSFVTCSQDLISMEQKSEKRVRFERFSPRHVKLQKSRTEQKADIQKKEDLYQLRAQQENDNREQLRKEMGQDLCDKIALNRNKHYERVFKMQAQKKQEELLRDGIVKLTVFTGFIITAFCINYYVQKQDQV